MSSQPDHTTPPKPPKRRFTPQWNLQTLLLFTALVAVSTGYWRHRREIPGLEREIEAMRQMARELIVKDHGKITVVELHELWMNDDRWDIYLPEGKYAIRVATREIDKTGFGPALAEAPIASGQHRVELRKTDAEDWEIVVLVDDERVIEAVEDSNWDPGHGFSGSGGYSRCTQLPPETPFELHRTRFMQPVGNSTYSTASGPTEGLLLWIERTE